MKKLLLILFIAFQLNVFAQKLPLGVRMDMTTWLTFTPKNYIKADSVKGARIGSIDIVVKSYDVYQTKSGQYYIYYKNARLTEHRKYLGYKSPYLEYEGNTVFTNSDSTKVWFWSLDRYGTPTMKMNLPDPSPKK